MIWHPRSKCCNAPIRLENKNDTTMESVCTICNKPCGFSGTEKQNAELKESLIPKDKEIEKIISILKDVSLTIQWRVKAEFLYDAGLRFERLEELEEKKVCDFLIDLSEINPHIAKHTPKKFAHYMRIAKEICARFGRREVDVRRI